ncbi:YjcG family protein [Bacillaceae bacterium]
MKYSIVIFPHSKIQEFANSYRKRYDPGYTLIPPHIKVKEPFEVAEEQIGEVVDKIAQVTEKTQPFTLRFHKASHFHPTNNVIYLAVEKSAELQKLHEALNEGILYHKPAYTFVPHLTIGQKMTDEELHDVYARLRMMKIDLTTTVDRVHLLYQLEDGVWTVYQTFLFGRPA